MSIFLRMLIAPLMAFSLSATAAVQRIECPSEIPADSARFLNTPAGWKSYVSGPLFLHNAAPADGPPERLGQMMGETIHKSKTKWTDKYSLEGRYPAGKWLQCDYGMLNEISLSRRLDDDTKECRIKGREGEKAGQNVFEIVCK